MGQSWSVDQVTYFEIQNKVSQNGRLVNIINLNEKEGFSYKGTAHTVRNGDLSRMWIEFGDVFHEKTINKEPNNQVSPLSKNRYMLQTFGTKFYLTDRAHESAKSTEAQSIRVIAHNELGTNRHPFLPPLPKKALKIGQSVPIGESYLQGLLGETYKVKRSKLVLSGTRQFDNVRCASFRLDFVAAVQFKNGIVLEITGTGEILTEIATSLHRSIEWRGVVKLSGGDVDAAGNKRSFNGLGKTARKTMISYLPQKKIAPITIGHVVPENGQRWDQVSKLKANLLRRFLDSDGQLKEQETSRHETNSFSVKVLKRTKSAVTKAEIKFSKYEKVLNAEAPDPKLKGLADKLLIIERPDPQKTSLTINDENGVKLEGEIGKAVSGAVRSAFRADRTDVLALLPKGPIKAFVPLRIDPKKALKALGEDFPDAKEIIVELVLIDTQTIDEQECAIFLVTMSVCSELKKVSEMTISGSAEMIVEIKTGWPVSLKDSAFLKWKESITDKNGKTLEMESFGPMKSTQLLRYGPRPKKGS